MKDDGQRKVSIAVLPETFNVLRTPLRTVGCWRLGDGVFRFDHKLIGRHARDEFDEFWKVREKYPTAPIALFGHTDPSGEDDYNHTLAHERAQAVYGVLNADPDMWFELFSSDEGVLPNALNGGMARIVGQAHDMIPTRDRVLFRHDTMIGDRHRGPK